MALHGEVSIFVHKATTLPSNLARDSNNDEVMHERRTIQSLIDSSKKPPYSRIDTILTNFSPEEYGNTKDVPRDVQAVFQIAGQLLSLDSSSDTTSMSWVIAKNFVTMPSTVDPRTLLKHPFLKLSQNSWFRWMLKVQ
ncbi:hypothetical protein UA08_09508 [Talaromyces atroroseus]|uniref:Uncharacterized protein n=1 Tax=Talaromyces atroroseus TaxID=1441469 RepID=A0A1Q5Q5X3_TALAT|nr:hypothetical protein UA08_09508 [Talaromyces atroroseus]OKL55225.1 hypothetical protein UA08_09508 [Talaromyces atroroseus]